MTAGHLAHEAASIPAGPAPPSRGAPARVAAGIFPPSFDYLALGHLHVPQRVSGSETMRYSGSPVALSQATLSPLNSLGLWLPVTMMPPLASSL